MPTKFSLAPPPQSIAYLFLSGPQEVLLFTNPKETEQQGFLGRTIVFKVFPPMLMDPSFAFPTVRA